MKTSTHDVGDTIALASTLSKGLQEFLSPLLLRLDQVLDRRLVRTFAATLEVFLQHRTRASGLLLSELGALLAGPAQAPAGTKRLSNLLRSSKWTYLLLEEWLWSEAERRFLELVCRGEETLLLWDASVLEKPESLALEGLCPVRSSEAARLKRIKKGFYTPPGGPPVFVPGMQWLCLLLLGRSGPPTLACMQWWTTRGALAQQRRDVEGDLLLRAHHRFGRAVLHIFDRGFAGGPWLSKLGVLQARFVLRWNTAYHLQNWRGQEKKAWQVTCGKRSWQHRSLWDARRGQWRSTGGVAARVHPAYPGPLWLVVSRPGQGRSPWYLLTNEPIDTAQDAWRVVFAYARRWQIEMAFRFTKTELALESPRLWSWANRLKLLLMVSLAYAFLLRLLAPECTALREALLARFCPRTGKRSRATPTPLYRLRIALCYLWMSTRTPWLPYPQSSG